MNAIFITTLSLLLPAQVHPSGLELKLVLDKTVIPRGDLAYCEVQLWNRRSSAVELPRISRPVALRVTVKVPDGELVETQLDGWGGVQGAPMQSINPGACFSIPAHIVLWNYDVLKTLHDEQKEIVGTATLAGYNSKFVTPVRFSCKISGRVASEELLLETLYQTGEERKDALRQAESLEQFLGSLDSIYLDRLLADSLTTANAIDKLIKQIRPGTAIWRNALIARLLIEYDTRENMPFDRFKQRLLRVVAMGGPSEQQWLLLRCATGLWHCGNPQGGMRVRELLEERLSNGSTVWSSTDIEDEAVLTRRSAHDRAR